MTDGRQLLAPDFFHGRCNVWTAPFPQQQVIGNTLISLCFETLVADGLFCFLATRQQRKQRSKRVVVLSSTDVGTGHGDWRLIAKVKLPATRSRT